MRPTVFIDTSYFLALINRRDRYHQVAKEIAKDISFPRVTSEAVLTELGNALARPPARLLAVRTLREIRASRDIEVVTIDQALFNEALALYRARPDKAWGLTDCTSFIIMRQRLLTQALTTDHHFEQAGFTRLLPIL